MEKYLDTGWFNPEFNSKVLKKKEEVIEEEELALEVEETEKEEEDVFISKGKYRCKKCGVTVKLQTLEARYRCKNCLNPITVENKI